MKTTATFSADATSFLANVSKNNRNATNYTATILAYGTWGSGSLTLSLSPDGGTTLIPITSSPGGDTAVLEANGMAQVFLGHPSSLSDTLEIYATLTGSTSPSLTVDCYDNNL